MIFKSQSPVLLTYEQGIDPESVKAVAKADHCVGKNDCEEAKDDGHENTSNRVDEIVAEILLVS